MRFKPKGMGGQHMRSWIAGLIVAILLGASGAAAQPRVLVLEGGTLIDGTGRSPIADAVVVVEGSRIKAVGTRGQVTYPTNATVIRLNGRTILPGLIDGHVHLKEYQLPMFLPYGVTTIADLDNDTAWILAQRELLKNGKIKGPRMFVSGGKMYGPLGPANPESTVVRTVDEARAYLRSLVAAGVDYLKVDDTITYDQLHTQNIRKAAEMGFKFQEHMDTMARALLDPGGKFSPRFYPPRSGPVEPPQVALESLVDPKQFPPLIDYLVKQGVYVNPTLTLTWSPSTPRGREWASAAAQVIKDPELGFIPADVKETWTRAPGPPRAGYANVAEFLRKYSEAGGKVVTGTDTGGSAVIPGLGLHHEVQMLTDLGIPPMKAIQGATLWTAEVIGQAKDLGSIEPGKLADFTVIEGNPLADIGATKNVRMVIKAGEVIDTKYDPKWVNPIPRPYSTAPQIAKLSPVMAPQNGSAITLQVEGTGFNPNAVVHFDNADLPTHLVSSTKLTATLDARFLRNVGSYPLYVVNPGVQGNVSRVKFFLVNFKY